MTKTVAGSDDQTTNRQSAPLFDDGEIDKFLKRRVCARCFGDLSKQSAEVRKWAAVCLSCGDAWNYSTVSRSAHEEQVAHQAEAALEIRAEMPDLFPRRKATAKQLLSELGY